MKLTGWIYCFICIPRSSLSATYCRSKCAQNWSESTRLHICCTSKLREKKYKVLHVNLNTDVNNLTELTIELHASGDVVPNAGMSDSGIAVIYLVPLVSTSSTEYNSHQIIIVLYEFRSFLSNIFLSTCYNSLIQIERNQSQDDYYSNPQKC